MDEDAVLQAIGEFRSDIRTMGREIGDLKKVLQEDAHNCRKCKDGIDGRLDAIEKKHEGEKAVSSFLDTTLGRVSVCVGILSSSATLIAVFVIPPLLTFLKTVV